MPVSIITAFYYYLENNISRLNLKPNTKIFDLKTRLMNNL